MSGNMGPFRPEELTGPDVNLLDAERAASYAAARELEQALASETIHPTRDFGDRVMAAVAREPAHRSASFLAPLERHHSLTGVVASVRAAWTVAIGGGTRPLGSRGLAMAYVLAVLLIGASLTGVAAYAGAGAMGLLTPDRTPAPSIVVPDPSRSPDASSETGEPSDSAEPSESPDASGPDESGGTNDPGESSSPGAGATPGASDDHGGATSSPSSDDHGGATSSPGSSGDDSSSSQTPRPSDTPKPSQSN